MPALRYHIKDLAVKALLKGVEKRIQNPQPALEEIGLVLVRSVAKTFKAGGRPVRWKASKRAQAKGGKTLIDTARLVRSISKRVVGKVLTVGTNVKYAAIHHFGGRIRKNAVVKQHWRYMDKAFGRPIPARHVLVKTHSRQMDIDMPARPFLVVQNSDWRIINRILADHVVGT